MKTAFRLIVYGLVLFDAVVLRRMVQTPPRLPRLSSAVFSAEKKTQTAELRKQAEERRRNSEKAFGKKVAQLATELKVSSEGGGVRAFAKLRNQASPAQIEAFEDLRLKAESIEILFEFLHHCIKDFNPVKEYIYSARCLSPSEFVSTERPGFDVFSFFTVRKDMNSIAKFYKKFYRDAPQIFLAKKTEGKDRAELAGLVRQFWAERKSDFTRLKTELRGNGPANKESENLEEILSRAARVECNVKDFLAFFRVLPRFFRAYMSPRPGLNTAPLYLKVGELRTRWVETIEKFFNRLAWISLWARLFDFLDFYLESQGAKSEVIVHAMEVLVNFSAPLTYTQQKLAIFAKNLKQLQEKLYFIISKIEKPPAVKFPNFDKFYLASVDTLAPLLALLLAALFGFF